VLPIVLRAVARGLDVEGGPVGEQLDPHLKPGAALVLHREAEGGLVAVDRLDA
jgi:hypothetical protein